MPTSRFESKTIPILIVEDEPVTALRLKMSLAKNGHGVEIAENGQQALDLLEQRFFPLVITDWEMPEIDGLELCRRIRANDSQSYCYIILLTAKNSKKDVVLGLEAGADDFLTKAPDYGELMARINSGLRILGLEQSLLRANQEIRAMSVTDPLTGCFNRSYIDQQLQKEIERARRYKHNLSMALCDIDYFKKVNDTYGHQAGDHVLKSLVGCIQETIRIDMDWIARYGGEEFLIVAPETDVDGACHMVERIRDRIAKETIDVKTSRIKITASFGVTGFGPFTSQQLVSRDLLFNQADRELYRAKMAGRDRMSVSDLVPQD